MILQTACPHRDPVQKDSPVVHLQVARASCSAVRKSAAWQMCFNHLLLCPVYVSANLSLKFHGQKV
jgi:hypothetical protein